MNTGNWKILIVEDTYDDVMVLSQILGHFDINIQIAHNGQKCIDMLETFTPHAIIMDLDMPDVDGWEALALIRSNPDTAGIPVVAITAYHSVEVAEEVSVAGFNAFFPKPLQPNALIEALSGMIDA